ncbi:MAG: PHP domain-containing protein [Tissierellia bacterium]|nr:PHP domain-containing protein [Tissierellia bacterium]
MKIIGDYHTHTVYSHGKGTIEDNLKAAINMELHYIGISDHGPNHVLYGLKREKYSTMRREVDLLNKKYNYYGTKLLLGVEANVIGFDGTIDVTDEDRVYLDYILLGYHYLIKMCTIEDYYLWFVRNQIDQSFYCSKKFKDITTKALIKAMERYPILAITHPGAKVNIDIDELAKAAKINNVALEINEKNHELSIEGLSKLADTDNLFLLSSDAHRSIDVGQVSNAINRVEIAGIDPVRIMNFR